MHILAGLLGGGRPLQAARELPPEGLPLPHPGGSWALAVEQGPGHCPTGRCNLVASVHH